jgi:polar amino acid transport system permease protein
MGYGDLATALAQGTMVTLQVTAGAALVAVVAACVAGLARASSRRWLRWPAAVYVELFRGTSALVQLFWIYFVLPYCGIDIGAMAAAIVALGLNTGAYGAEVVRGAISTVAQGQRDAAAALNLSAARTLRRIVWPQAVPVMLPPAGNLAIELLKNSALVSLIAVIDLTFAAQLARTATLQTAPVFTAVLLIYFALALCITASMRLLERRLGAT